MLILTIRDGITRLISWPQKEEEEANHQKRELQMWRDF